MPVPARLRRFWLVLIGRLRSVRIGCDPAACPPGTIVLLPRRPPGLVLRCGIAALVEVSGDGGPPSPATDEAAAVVDRVTSSGLEGATLSRTSIEGFAGGDAALDLLTAWARGLKRAPVFERLFSEAGARAEVLALAALLREFADAEESHLAEAADRFAEADLEVLSARVLRVRDVAWHVENEALSLVEEVRGLAGDAAVPPALVTNLRRVAAVLRSVDRIEIRGRDSAGIAVQVAFPSAAARERFLDDLGAEGLRGALAARSVADDLPAEAVCVPEDGRVVTFVYKVAAEVGRLGDNISAVRRQVRGDALLARALASDGVAVVVLGHTRWASSGVISEPNCHPVDNETVSDGPGGGEARGVRGGRIFVVMNGDVDNHLELRAEYERDSGRSVSAQVTTDTKVVALEIERHLAAGHGLDDAFRRACARFDGSCAIGMISDLAPGRLYLSLRGSGQSLYVGVAPDGFFASSEVYGLVEQTGRYLKMDGEAQRVDGEQATAGQVVVLDGSGPAGADGVVRAGFDGVPLPVQDDDIRQAEITTRDVDRGDFQHFFRKEITQASRSVARTLLGRITVGVDGDRPAEHLLSPAVRERLRAGAVQRIYVVGQGTAAIAGSGIAEYLRRVLPVGAVLIDSLPATEMSGFRLADDMTDTVVVAVTQSGSTADTNRAVDLARKRGALVVAIVNRRNSDITYRADGVIYTSDGRDVEMSVASTKAFYAQIVAGALFSLSVAAEIGSLTSRELARELSELRRLPELMQRVLDDESAIRTAAERHAPTREHWAVVASGPNQVAAREVRIKLSELCYKSIAVDTVEDKKHIDLSSEPMTIVLAAGNPESVLNDVVKDVAIFKAHTGCPIVFCSDGETRFDPYASAVVHLPVAPPLSSMVLSALAGHLFGYHAARAIDENARFLAGVRSRLVAALADAAVRERLPSDIGATRREFLTRLAGQRFTSSLNPVTAARLAMLFDRVTGAVVVTDDDRAFLDGEDGDMVAAFVNVIGDALDECARPIDAIKHQAKIVTVGTSRPEAQVPGAIAAALQEAGVSLERIAPVDVFELHRIGPAVAAVAGITVYEIGDLLADGTPGPATRIRVVERTGVAAGLRTRAVDWTPLIGTKHHVVATRRLHVGVGRGDRRRIAIVPLRGETPGVNGLALLHLDFVPALGAAEKERVLGPRLSDLRDLVTESNQAFDTALLDALTPEQVVVESPEDLAERLLAQD